MKFSYLLNHLDIYAKSLLLKMRSTRYKKD